MTGKPDDMMAGFLTTAEASHAMRISVETLKKWRMLGKGPTPCRIGGKVYYRDASLREWIEAEASREYR